MRATHFSSQCVLKFIGSNPNDSGMNWASVCAAVIPCLNEEAAIPALIPGVRAHVSTLIVVDDGSSDETARLAQSADAVVLRHQTSQGKGAALQTGWRYARERGFEWALTLDVEGQHWPE